MIDRVRDSNNGLRISPILLTKCDVTEPIFESLAKLDIIAVKQILLFNYRKERELTTTLNTIKLFKYNS